MEIEQIIRARAAEIRQMGTSLIGLADMLDALDIKELLVANAPEIFRRLIDDDKAKTARVTELEAEKSAVDALATEAETVLMPVADTLPADGGTDTVPA